MLRSPLSFPHFFDPPPPRPAAYGWMREEYGREEEERRAPKTSLPPPLFSLFNRPQRAEGGGGGLSVSERPSCDPNLMISLTKGGARRGGQRKVWRRSPLAQIFPLRRPCSRPDINFCFIIRPRTHCSPLPLINIAIIELTSPVFAMSSC